MDVAVTVRNENIDIVRDTVRAALSIDYPYRRFRVIVADDGRSERLRAWIDQLGIEHPNCDTTPRVQGSAAGRPANLNEAIKFSDGLPGGAADFVAGLDADMIPEPRWLRTVTAHLMRDHKLGVVCPAQVSDYFMTYVYTHPTSLAFSLANSEASAFLQCALRMILFFQSNDFSWYSRDLICDLAGAGFNLGSGWVMRREAIEDIGGFPTDVLTEDITSSMMTMAEGWKTAYIPEALQWGLVPETYAAHVKQLTRWV